MNWKARYEKITNINQVKVGDFISIAPDSGEKYYTIIEKIKGNIICSNLSKDKERVLNNRGTIYLEIDITTTANTLRFEKR